MHLLHTHSAGHINVLLIDKQQQTAIHYNGRAYDNSLSTDNFWSILHVVHAMHV